MYQYIYHVSQDEVTQVNGLIMVTDLNGIGWAHAKNMSPLYAKRVTSLLQVHCSHFSLLVCHYSQVHSKITSNFFLVSSKGKSLWLSKVHLKLSETTILQILIYRSCLLHSLSETIASRINPSEGWGVDSSLRSVDNLLRSVDNSFYQ